MYHVKCFVEISYKMCVMKCYVICLSEYLCDVYYYVTCVTVWTSVKIPGYVYVNNKIVLIFGPDNWILY